jgi:hypothetical protein
MKILSLLIPIPLLVACGGPAGPGDDDVPGPDAAPSVGPTALARCGDPARTIDRAWEVDNIRAPLVAQTQLGSTLLVSSGDGAVKTWTLPAAGGAPQPPSYGTPFVDDGDPVPVLAVAPPGPTPAFVGIDVNGGAHVWGAGGTTLHAPFAFTAAAGSYVAIDSNLRWLAGGTAEFAGGLTVADLETGDVTGPLETAMWHVTDAAIGHGGVLVTVGDWYGCPAIELRDPRNPTVVTGYWDGCHWDGPMLQSWFHSVAVNADATEAIAVGDGLYARFDLAAVAAGPVGYLLTDDRYDHVAWSVDDDLAFALGPTPSVLSKITVWSTTDDVIRRSTTIPVPIQTVGLTLDPTTGTLITARADGMIRGDLCSE